MVEGLILDNLDNACDLIQIFRLESERAQWEQRYLEETAMRQVAIDAASIPKDAKIAALEKSGAESEKVIAEARVERMKQIEEIDVSKVSEIYLSLSLFICLRFCFVRNFHSA